MTEIKKYELIMDDTKDLPLVEGRKAYRIRALRDFGNVKAGDLGGYIENEKNLSHDFNCWVGGNAVVTGNSRIKFNAQVYDNANISGHVIVEGKAEVYGHVIIYDRVKIKNRSKVYGKAKVFGTAVITDYAEVYGSAEIFMSASISDHAKIYGECNVYGNAKISGEAEIFGYADVSGSSSVFDKAQVADTSELGGVVSIRDNAIVGGNAEIFAGTIGGRSIISGDVEISTDVHFTKKAIISSKKDYMLFDCVGSEDGILTAFQTKKSIAVTRGCFSGSLKRFKKTVEEVHSDNPKVLKEYRTIIKLIEDRLGGEK